MQLRAETTVNTQELLVHDRRQRQRTEGFDARLVDPFAILVFALELEGKVVRQVATLVVTAQQPERIGIPDLQCPEVQNALQQSEPRIQSEHENTHLNAEIATVDVVTQE